MLLGSESVWKFGLKDPVRALPGFKLWMWTAEQRYRMAENTRKTKGYPSDLPDDEGEGLRLKLLISTRVCRLARPTRFERVTFAFGGRPFWDCQSILECAER